MATSLSYPRRRCLACLLALALLPATAQAQRRTMTSMHPFQTPVRSNLPATTLLNTSLFHTGPAGMLGTAAAVLDRAAGLNANRATVLARAAQLSGTPLQRAGLLNAAVRLDQAAMRDAVQGAALGRIALTPTQVAAMDVLSGRALMDRSLLDGLQRAALFSAFNPNAMTAFPANMSNLYATNWMVGSSYGGSSYGYGGYLPTMSSPTSSPSNPYAYAPPATSTDDGTLLSAPGVPAKNGHLKWPLGLRILAPAPQAAMLRRQIDGILQLDTTQSGGQLSAKDVRSATEATEQLRALLRKNSGRVAMAEATYRDATQFLDQLDLVLLSMKDSPPVR
jgi:hypothetical protein